MTDQPDTLIPPPNGERVTQAQLYKALYDLDQGLSRRHTTVLDTMNEIRSTISSVSHGVNILGEAYRQHTADGHPQINREATIREEIKLDTRKAALGAAALGVLTAIVTGLVKLVDYLFAIIHTPTS